MIEIAPDKFDESIFRLLGKDWALITSGDIENFNMMTASWGGAGVLWAKPVATIYVRPERYTHEYIERTRRFTLSFFPSQLRQALAEMGSKSGRNFDKMHYEALTPIELPSQQVAFAQARIVMDCQVLYKDTMAEDKFLDKQPLEKWYGGEHGNLHDIYIAEIKHIWINE